MADIDGDGDFDVLSGNAFGFLHYLENTGTKNKPQFTQRTGVDNPFDTLDFSFQSSPGRTPNLNKLLSCTHRLCTSPCVSRIPAPVSYGRNLPRIREVPTCLTEFHKYHNTLRKYQ